MEHIILNFSKANTQKEAMFNQFDYATIQSEIFIQL